MISERFISSQELFDVRGNFGRPRIRYCITLDCDSVCVCVCSCYLLRFVRKLRTFLTSWLQTCCGCGCKEPWGEIIVVHCFFVELFFCGAEWSR